MGCCGNEHLTRASSRVEERRREASSRRWKENGPPGRARSGYAPGMNTTNSAGLVLLSIAAASHAAIIERPIEYTHDGTTLTGVLVFDDEEVSPDDTAPGVLVIHEWWGLNDYAKRRARMLAELGYVAFAADIYGIDEPVTTGEEAGALAGPFYADRGLFRGRVKAGLDVLKAQPECDAERLGAIGYCFGGTAVLELARAAPELDAGVSFHGGLSNPTPDDDADIEASILICHGAIDPYVPTDEVVALIESFETHGVDYVFTMYAGAKHAFTNPQHESAPAGAGVNYVKAADVRSWEAMEEFFEETLDHDDDQDGDHADED